MKRTKEEIITRFKEIVGDDNTSDEVLSFVEDVADSFTEDDYKAKYDELKVQYVENDAAWRKKYRDRFEQPVEREAEDPENRDTGAEAKTYTYEELFEKE